MGDRQSLGKRIRRSIKEINEKLAVLNQCKYTNTGVMLPAILPRENFDEYEEVLANVLRVQGLCAAELESLEKDSKHREEYTEMLNRLMQLADLLTEAIKTRV